jgi:hypothetical protein
VVNDLGIAEIPETSLRLKIAATLLPYNYLPRAEAEASCKSRYSISTKSTRRSGALLDLKLS